MIHEALRLLRAHHELSENECSTLLGLSRGQLERIESGADSIGESILYKYSSTFGVPISSLVFFSEKNNGGITEGLRIGLAKKAISLLQWLEARNAKKA